MGEAIISRSGGGSGSGAQYREILKTKIITNNEIWEVPKINSSKGVSVRLFGGGGGGSTDGSNLYGGGGGNMVNTIFTNISEGMSISIIIGEKGLGSTASPDTWAKAGGTSAFGSYISATGGEAGIDNGGNGGSGGGAYSYRTSGHSVNGGYGTYGGGGGAQARWANSWAWAGNGGMYGGGGGVELQNSSKWSYVNKSYGGIKKHIEGSDYNAQNVSGYGGNGGIGNSRAENAENGTNTVGMGLEFEGIGIAGRYINYYESPYSSMFSSFGPDIYASGGGGYGGCGGAGAGGGGGYGGNGGSFWGGGGGYGGNGGNGGGGGGGYGLTGKGGDGSGTLLGSSDAGIAGGGGAGTNGGPGICIIQYYQLVSD